MILSSKNKKAIPAANPAKAGAKARRPKEADMSIAGIKSDQTLAATMTPAAKPKRPRSRLSFILPFKKKTVAAPSVVPKNGRARPKKSALISALYCKPFQSASVAVGAD